MKTAVNSFIKLRSDKFPKKSEYIFAMLNGGDGHVRGHDALREASGNCSAKKPEFLRSTKLRKQLPH